MTTLSHDNIVMAGFPLGKGKPGRETTGWKNTKTSR